jgi:hypothetical protein
MKKPEEDVHVLIKLSREMRGEKVSNSIVINTEEGTGSAHVWQTTKDNIFVLFKDGRKFTEFEHFEGNAAFAKAKSFAKKTLLRLLQEQRDVNALR